ncbi:hypothetical protein ACJ73_05187 [Blastomyces percursus]|uniref:HNH nuclease domain-containing protein n=1 Tax=Blastomyces percursus TaxID=1658174 RepID=A0A1J9R4N5_9EURO|nr:hypothetical protein ACJ73_05187 [Blastomyces percursus]
MRWLGNIFSCWGARKHGGRKLSAAQHGSNTNWSSGELTGFAGEMPPYLEEVKPAQEPAPMKESPTDHRLGNQGPLPCSTGFLPVPPTPPTPPTPREASNTAQTAQSDNLISCTNWDAFVAWTQAPSPWVSVGSGFDGLQVAWTTRTFPVKAVGTKTPQPTPGTLSARRVENVVGTPARLSTLRRDCLIRDHQRCVITQKFDAGEAVVRMNRDHLDAEDDDGQRLPAMDGEFEPLEVAHIIPHSIMSATIVDGQMQLSESKKTALSILNMFDPGSLHLIEGPNIDSPRNALTLTHAAHTYFGKFAIYFDAVNDDSTDLKHTYKIQSNDFGIEFILKLPVTRTLLLSPNHTIDPPSSKLLALHRQLLLFFILVLPENTSIE